MVGITSLAAVHSVSAQTPPTYAPSSPLLAPGDPNSDIDQYSVPAITIPKAAPQSTIPQSTIPNSNSLQPIPDPGNAPLQGTIPSQSNYGPSDPATIVAPGTGTQTTTFWRGWYPGYWMGVRPGDQPYGGGPVPYRTNYQGFAPYGAGSLNNGCNACGPAPVGNLDFGRGYDGFMTGW